MWLSDFVFKVASIVYGLKLGLEVEVVIEIKQESSRALSGSFFRVCHSFHLDIYANI